VKKIFFRAKNRYHTQTVKSGSYFGKDILISVPSFNLLSLSRNVICKNFQGCHLADGKSKCTKYQNGTVLHLPYLHNVQAFLSNKILKVTLKLLLLFRSS
jgi:hypothetical protein